jgi:hypothetical protein
VRRLPQRGGIRCQNRVDGLVGLRYPLQVVQGQLFAGESVAAECGTQGGEVRHPGKLLLVEHHDRLRRVGLTVAGGDARSTAFDAGARAVRRNPALR